MMKHKLSDLAATYTADTHAEYLKKLSDLAATYTADTHAEYLKKLSDLAATHTADTHAEYLKANDAARFLNVSRRTFERMRALGQLPHIRCGGGRVLRYRRCDLIESMSRLTVR